jgi:predicted nucleotidyltransferase
MMKTQLPSLPVNLVKRWPGMEDCLKVISGRVPVKKMILFGSYAMGKATEDSDVDLCVVTEEAEWQLVTAKKIRNSLWNVPNCPPLTLIPITPQRLSEKLSQHDPFFEEIIHQGIVLTHED